MDSKFSSIALSNPHKVSLSNFEKFSFSIALLGVAILALAFVGINLPNKALFLTLSLSMMVVGTTLYARSIYLKHPEGIRNNHVWFNTLSNKGIWGWTLGLILTGFYVIIYWYPQYLGYATGVNGTNEGLVALFDPLSQFFKGKAASQWFLYGTLYTVIIIALGIKFLYKYRHNRYQKIS